MGSRNGYYRGRMCGLYNIDLRPWLEYLAGGQGCQIFSLEEWGGSIGAGGREKSGYLNGISIALQPDGMQWHFLLLLLLLHSYHITSLRIWQQKPNTPAMLPVDSTLSAWLPGEKKFLLLLKTHLVCIISNNNRFESCISPAMARLLPVWDFNLLAHWETQNWETVRKLVSNRFRGLFSL